MNRAIKAATRPPTARPLNAALIVALLVMAPTAVLMAADPAAANHNNTLLHENVSISPSSITVGAGGFVRDITVSNPINQVPDSADGDYDLVQFRSESGDRQAVFSDTTSASVGWTAAATNPGGTSRNTLEFTGGTVEDGTSHVFTVGFEATGALADGDSMTLDVRVRQASGALSIAPLTVNLDLAAPGAPDAVALDDNANGAYDALELTFEDAISDASVRLADFQVNGATPTGFDTGATTDDGVFKLLFADVTGGAAAIPDVTYTPGTLADTYRNLVAAVATADVVETDGAGPVPLVAIGSDGSADVLMIFSEAVANALEAADFAYNGGAPGDGIASVSHDAASSTATVTLDAALTATSLGSDTLGVVADAAEDEAGNLGPAVTLTIDTPKATDLTGTIGSPMVTMIFNGPVDNGADAGLDATDFSLTQVPGGDVTSIVSVDHAPGNDRAVITLDEPISPADAGVGAGSPIEIEILADSAFAFGASGIDVPATSLPLVDTTPPSIAAISTIGDGSGSIEALEIKLTEFFDRTATGVFEETDWAIEGVGNPTSVTPTPPGRATPQGDIDRLYLKFDGAAAGFDTAATPDVSYSGTVLADLLGNVMAAANDVASRDAAPPVLASALTRDADGDGEIDGIQLTFTEAIDDESVDVGEFSVEDDGGTWATAIRAASGFTSGTEDDAVVTIEFPESGAADTAVVPVIHYAPTATLKDLAGTGAEAFSVRATDGVAPVIMQVLATPGSAGATVRFSEPVKMAVGGALDGTSLSYINVNSGGASAITGVTHDLVTRPSEVLVTFNAPVSSGDIDQDTVGAAPATIAGQADDRVVGVARATLTDSDRPAVESAKTLDRDADGYLDAIEVTFNRAVSDSFAGSSLLAAADWTLPSPYGDANGNPANVVTSLAGAPVGADDATIFLLFDEELVEKPDGDTADTPTVSYAGGRLIDATGHPLGRVSSQSAADGALPRLMRIQGDPGATEVELFFSEGVRGSGTGGALAVANLQYVNSNGVGAGSIASVSHAGGDRAATATLNRALSVTGADHGLGGSTADAVRARTTVIETSAAGGKAVVGGVDVSISDTTAPAIASIRTVDQSGGAANGRIDALIVTFTEPVQDGTLPVDQWIVGAPYGDANDNPLSVTTGATADDKVIVLELDELQTGTDTEVTPTVTFAATDGILDLVGNGLEDFQDRRAGDGAAPVVLGLETRDSDQDGHIDGLLVEFSEDMDDASFSPDDWTIIDSGNSRIVGAQVGDDGAVDDAFVLVTFAEDTDYDTIATPQATFSATGHLADIAGNTVAGFQQTAADGAPAVIAALGGSPGSSTAEVRFSEPVRASGGGALGVGAFTYVNAASGGATGVGAVSHTEGEDIAIITLDEVLATADFDDDEVGAAPNAIQEYRAGTCSATVDCLITPDHEASFVDLDGPKVTEAVTLDIDANGRIDAVRVTFDEAILDGAAGANLVDADWKILRGTTEVAAISVLSDHPNAVPGASADDDTIYVTFAEAATGYDTADTPQVRYTPGSGGRIQDHDRHVFGGRTFATTDGAGPVVVDATTLDADSNGAIDRYQITMSEAVEDDTLDFADWGVAGTTVTGINTAATGLAGAAGSRGADDNVFAILFTENAALGTGSLPDVTYAPVQAITDLAGNDAHGVAAGGAAAAGVDEMDGAAPVLLGVATRDDGLDGHLDRAILTFSEAIDDGPGGQATFAKGEWTVPAGLGDAAGRPADVTTGGRHSDDKAIMTFVAPAADAPYTGGLRPSVTYTPTATIADAAGNKMLAATVTATDGARPVIAGTSTIDRDDDGLVDGIKVTFTEDIDDVVAGVPNLVTADWTLEAPYGDAANQPRQVATTITNGGRDDATIYLLFDEDGTAGTDYDTGATPWAELAAASQLVDLAGNAIGGTLRHTSSDAVVPRLLSATTVDLDGNTFIDGYGLLFSEAIKDSSFKASEWSVQGTDVDDFLTGQASNDAYIVVTFDETAALDSGATPELTYTPTATLTDSAGNGLRAVTTAGVSERDGVAPTFLRAVSKGLQSATVDLEFSEQVISAGNGITTADFLYTDVSADGASGLTFISPTADGRKLTLSINAPFLQSDNGVDTIGVLAGTLKDVNGNALPATTRTIRADLEAPDQVFDLDVRPNTLGRRAVTLEWTTPTAVDSASFDLRRSSSPITPANFATATQVSGLPTPNPGAVQHVDVTGLTPDTKYYYAIKTIDRVGNAAVMSNVLVFTTVADLSAPGKVADLAIQAGSIVGNGAVLTWTAPGDDDFDADPAASYEIRFSKDEITAANFAQAGSVTSPPTPKAGSTAETFSLTGLTTETKYYVAIRATDAVGNVGEISNVISFTTTTDSTPPTSAPVISSTTHTSGVPSQSKVPVLSWTAVTDPDSSVKYHYKLSTLATDTVASTDTSTTERTVTLPEQTDGTYYFHLAAFSEGGSAAAQVFKIVIDTVAPGTPGLKVPVDADVTAITATLRWTAPGNDLNTGTATAYDLRYSTAAITASNFATATAVTGMAAPKAFGQDESFTVTGLTPQTEYHFALRALDGAGNAGPISAIVKATTKADTTAPVGTLAIASTTHSASSLSTVRSAAFTWSGASDPESALRYHYRLSADETYEVQATDTQLSVAELTISDIANGRHFLHVRAASDGGLGPQATYAFAVLSLTNEELAKLRADTRVEVEEFEGGHRITWTLPEDLPGKLLGVQVWYSNSPYKLLQTVDVDSPEFLASAVTHLGDEAKESTQYIVTLFFGDSEDFGKFSDSNNTVVFPSDLRGHSVVVDQSGIPLWGWMLIGLGALAVLALLIALIVVARRRDHEAVEGDEPVAYRWGEDEWDQDGWDAPENGAAEPVQPAAPHVVSGGNGMAMAMMPVHDVECPACSADFAVEGERPLTTTCPSCGVRGVLS